MAYVNRNQDFISGAEYEPITDTLPSKAESILYGIKYSEKPLEFDVDIVNPDEDIPMKQMMEIKDWLFGQDGWKKLYIKCPDYENMYLKCLLIPENDIRDSTGYRGVRCKIKNISGFWYGEDEVITYTKAQINEMTNNGADLVDDQYLAINPVIKTQCREKVYPLVKFMATSEDFGNRTDFLIGFHNNKIDSESDLYIGISLANQGKEVTADCEWGTYEIQDTEYQLTNLQDDYDIFYLEKGENNILIKLKFNNSYKPPSYFSLVYTPKLRVGGF